MWLNKVKEEVAAENLSVYHYKLKKDMHPLVNPMVGVSCGMSLTLLIKRGYSFSTHPPLSLPRHR